MFRAKGRCPFFPLRPEAVLSSTTKNRSVSAYCRGLIILVCVVALPLLAVVWDRLPSVDSFVGSLAFDTTAPSESDTNYRSEPAAPVESFPPSQRLDPPALAPFETEVPEAMFPSAPPQPLRDVSPFSSSTPSPAPISQAAFASPAFAPPEANPFLASAPTDVESGGEPVANPLAAPVVPAFRLQDAQPSESDRQQLHTRLGEELKQLGAQFYRLQTWGNRGELYRFSCYVAAPDNDQYQRHFQAIDADSIQAMRQVLDEVKIWRAGFRRTAF